MSYPKPLSQPSLEKRYKEAGLSQEARDFLHKLFAACANLYGALMMRDVWEIYRMIPDAPKLRRKDLLAFSAIARREVQPYYVYEIDELYSEERRGELDRFVIHKDLIGYGYGKCFDFYNLVEQLGEQPFCVPDDLLSYAVPKPSEEEVALFKFLSGLESVAEECAPKFGTVTKPNANRGKKLGEFSFMNTHEEFELEWLEKQPKARAAFLEKVSGTEAEKIMRQYMHRTRIGYLSPSQIFEYMLDELKEVGVDMDDDGIQELLDMTMDCHNNSRLWCLRGWTSAALYRSAPSDGPVSISFGPNMQRAFADGTMDRAEIEKRIKELGLKVIE